MSRWFAVSATNRVGIIIMNGLLEFHEQHDKRATLPQKTAGHKYYEKVANFHVTCYEEVTDLSGMSLACYEVVSVSKVVTFCMMEVNDAFESDGDCFPCASLKHFTSTLVTIILRSGFSTVN